MNDVSVVVPNWNGGARLERVLASLAAQTEPPARILVVDNGSSDDSAQAATRSGAELIKLDRNYGFARAVNEGLRCTTTPMVAIVNNDVVLAPDYLERLQAALDQSHADYATGRLRQAGTDRIDGTFDLLSRGAMAWRAGHAMPAQNADQPADVHFVPMTAALFRTAVFEELGLLDENFVSYLEDVDFGLRCAQAGKMGLYVPQADAEHIGSATLGAWSSAQVELLARNQVLLVAKYFPARWIWRLGWAVFVAQALWGILAIRRGCGLAWLRGKMAGWCAYRDVRRAARPFSILPFMRLTCEHEARMRSLGAAEDAYWRWYFRLAG